jgi:hypothetical protein
MLGSAITALKKEYVRDTVYTRHTSNFRVLHPNKILGIEQRKTKMPIEDAKELAALWGSNKVHPSQNAYKVIAKGGPEGPRQLGVQIDKRAPDPWHHSQDAAAGSQLGA